MRLQARFFFACSIFFACVFFIPFHVEAATLYIDPFEKSILKGDTVTMAVRLDVDEGECVNTVDAVVSYDQGVQLVDVSRGRSILPLWVEEPKIDTGARRITFAGGIPNGYCGRTPGDPSLTNVLVELVFRAPGFTIGSSQNTSAQVRFEGESRVLLNDGFGTEAQLKTIPSTLTLVQQVGTTSQDNWRDSVNADTVPPQPFSIDLTQTEGVFDDKYYIVFNTTDKQSGIDHYEVIEEPRTDVYSFRWGRADAPWEKTQSPYVLKDQTLSSIIRVKALDKAGNERITVLIPDDTARRLDILTWVLLGILGFVFFGVVTGFVWWFIRRRMRKQDTLREE